MPPKTTPEHIRDLSAYIAKYRHVVPPEVLQLLWEAITLLRVDEKRKQS